MFIFPFEESGRDFITVFQVRRMGGGKWGPVQIQWRSHMTATADQAVQFCSALQEAARVCRQWENDIQG
jgi:hypothetical protein